MRIKPDVWVAVRFWCKKCDTTHDEKMWGNSDDEGKSYVMAECRCCNAGEIMRDKGD